MQGEIQQEQIDIWIASAERGDMETMSMLLATYPDLVNCRGEFGWTALHRSVIFGHHEVVRLLIQSGADVNAMDDSLSTPLHNVAMNHESGFIMTMLLLKFGANLETKNKLGRSPLLQAAGDSNFDVFIAVLAAGADIASVNNEGRNTREELQYQLHGIQNRKKYRHQIRDIKKMIGILDILVEY